MVPFIHAADIHLDSPLKGLFQYEGAPDIEEIRGATRQALENMVGFILSEKIPLLIIAGDLYDGDWKDFNTGLYFSSQMQRLGEAGVRVAIVRGNHDAANKMTRTLSLPENVKIFSARKAESWLLDDMGIAIHGQSYATAEMTENLAVSYPEPVQGMINVGVLHCLISGSKGHLPYAPCTLDELAARGYDYWALGHVHEHALLRDRPLIVYAGCSQGRHIRETGQKGCVLVEADRGVLKTKFVPLDAFRWIHVRADITGTETMEQALAIFTESLGNEMANQHGKPCCVRVTFTGRCPIHGRLSADPENLAANIRTLAADVSHRSAWIEKIVLDTSHEIDMEALAESDSPQGELLRFMNELSAGSQPYQDLGVDLTKLKALLAGSGVALPEKDMNPLLLSARDILLTLLSDMNPGEKRS